MIKDLSIAGSESEEDYSPRKTVSFSQRSAPSSLRKSTPVKTIKKEVQQVGNYLVVMYSVVTRDLNQLVYIFLPALPVESKNIRPKIVENGHQVQVDFIWSGAFMRDVQDIVGGYDMLLAGFREAYKKLKVKQDVPSDGNLKTTLMIKLPFQCEQKFFSGDMLGGGYTSHGYQVVIGSSEDGNTCPILQMCLIKTKDIYNVDSSQNMKGGKATKKATLLCPTC